MNRENIIRMAREAGFEYFDEFPEDYQNKLERFAKLVRDDYSNKHANLWLDRIHTYMLAEREACAKVCEDLDLSQDSTWQVATLDCAAAIRARGETK